MFAIFFALVNEMRFGPALVNEQKITKTMRDGIYSFTWILGLCVSFIFMASPLTPWFYENDLYPLLVSAWQ